MWWSSLHFAQYFLAHDKGTGLFQPERLSGRAVFEIGSGTGVLPAYLFANQSWTVPGNEPIKWIATDQAELLPLLSRNLKGKDSPSVKTYVDEYDWTYIQSLTNPRHRKDYLAELLSPFSSAETKYPDLVLCVDCVYNPALFRALANAIEAVCAQHTVVVIVVQLRAYDTIHEFLDVWLRSGKFCAYSVEDSALPPAFRQGYAIWIAWLNHSDINTFT